jgi:DNA polymerase-3 subunit alpha
MINIENIPLDDQETYTAFANGETISSFQMESNSFQRICKMIKPNTIEEISDANAIARPGALQFLDSYVQNKEHPDEIKYIHPLLEPILNKTHGTALYQENIMAIAHELGGLTLAESDSLRRAISKKKPEAMKPLFDKFIEGGIKNGIDREILETLVDQIQDWAAYGFNKSHSVAYALHAYRSMYLKVHYPLEWFTACLNAEIGNTETITSYIREARRLGIKILPPSVAHSKSKYTIENDGIRFGLNAIKGVGGTEYVPAESFDEFIENNTNVNKGTLEALIKAGAFPESRGLNLAKLAWLQTEGDKLKKAKQKLVEYEAMANAPKDDKELKKALRGISTWNLKLSAIQPFDNQPLIVNEPQLEREVLGMYLTTSPMDLFTEQLTTNTWTWEEFLETGEGGHVIVGGMVKKIKLHTDKRGNEMAFLTLECYMGDVIDITFFSSLWSKWGNQIHEDGIIRVDGKKNNGNNMLANSVAIYR